MTRSSATVHGVDERMLCKFIFINLRMTITHEEVTGVKANYLVPNRYFPAPAEQLIAA